MNGLSSHEAEIRLKKFGLNVIEETKRKTLIAFFIDQLSNLLVILLIIASAISFIVGEHIDAALILAIVFLNALFGIYQEKKAGESIAALKKLTINNIRVRRDGKDIEIESKFLVPGDMVFIEEGVRIPADGKVIESINLEINESSLTGESLAVSKSISDQVFMGTIVSKGRGYLEITKTGMETKFGEIAAHLSGIEIKRTPLQIKIASLSRIIGIVGIALAALIFVLSLLQGSTYFPAFLLSVSLAVAVVPEGLPAVMTVTLAIGVKEMAKKKSIMKNLAAIEALGNITLIATDKTGTITTNKMQVKEVYVNNKVYTLEDIADTKNETLTLLTLNGILCSTAS
ncbi:MAG TPA: HAD-IC family P-type ATPase, partial [Candidatus Nitrosocosmicus sp.]|nr:HAD-IC family P-type ATPase [Candidatus Nitrosocosmicus sp.]